jgi:hypothetical protein
MINSSLTWRESVSNGVGGRRQRVARLKVPQRQRRRQRHQVGAPSHRLLRIPRFFIQYLNQVFIQLFYPVFIQLFYPVFILFLSSF